MIDSLKLNIIYKVPKFVTRSLNITSGRVYLHFTFILLIIIPCLNIGKWSAHIMGVINLWMNYVLQLLSRIVKPKMQVTYESIFKSPMSFSHSLHQGTVVIFPNHPHWDTYLSNITSLFVESQLADLDDTFEEIGLLFDDSHITFFLTPLPSLDLSFAFLTSTSIVIDFIDLHDFNLTQ